MGAVEQGGLGHMTGPSKCRDVLADAIASAEAATVDLAKARACAEDIRVRIRQAQLEADETGRQFEAARTGGELLERGAVRAARDKLVDAKDLTESLRSALSRSEKEIEKQNNAEFYTRINLRTALGRVIVSEVLDPLIARAEALEAWRRCLEKLATDATAPLPQVS
jgi:hypothetical protein